MSLGNEEFLWVERYRPKTIDECILPGSIKATFAEFLKAGDLPNLLLAGTAGTGKTTVARALCEQSGADYIIINGSEESGIDVLRTKIKQFASTVSFSGSRNYKNRIIDPIHSRCSVIDFRINNEDKPQIASQFMTRMQDVLASEGIDFDRKVVAELIKKHFPDFRRVINELQRYSVSGKIDTGILVQVADVSIKGLMESLRDKDFKSMRKWVVENIDNDPTRIFRKIYDSMYEYIEPESIPQTVVTLADYSYKHAFCADGELNLVACLTELMVDAKFTK
jgi:DNA polymerase III delta prime subunit